MNATAPVILRSGLATSVGLSAPAACAAIRAGITNPTETRFMDSAGDWIIGHSVPVEGYPHGPEKLRQMAVLSIVECLTGVPVSDWRRIPLLLCVAENERPGRSPGLDDALLTGIRQALPGDLSEQSLTIANGRVGFATALMHARALIGSGSAARVLIVAADSLLNSSTLSGYERNERLLTARNSNGFMPGEGAGAVLLGTAKTAEGLCFTGVGFSNESATVESKEPLRADGLLQAIQDALRDSGCEMQDLHFRICDVSGEHYYFKEAALALTRALRARKEEFDIWHPAECIGETGALAGLATAILADAACRNGYAPGPNVLCHAGNDAGQRAAVILQFRAH